jgi:hypothetical protein
MMAYLLNKPIRRNEILKEIVAIPLNPPKLERQEAYVEKFKPEPEQYELKIEEKMEQPQEQQPVLIPEPEPMDIDFVEPVTVSEPPKKYLSAFELMSKVKK